MPQLDEVLQTPGLHLELLGGSVGTRPASCVFLAEDLLDWSCGLLEGATGAEIEEVANSALAAAVFEEDGGESRPRITRAHLEEALDRVSRHIAQRKVGFERVETRER